MNSADYEKFSLEIELMEIQVRQIRRDLYYIRQRFTALDRRDKPIKDSPFRRRLQVRPYMYKNP